jgi:hypothetical protein
MDMIRNNRMRLTLTPLFTADSRAANKERKQI